MGMTEESGYSLERAIIRLGGAFALLVAVLPWLAFLFGLPLFLSGYTVLGDMRELLFLVNSNKLSYAAFLIPFIVAALAILPVILAVFLRFRRTSVVLGALFWGAGTFMIELGMLLSLSLLPLSDRLIAAGSAVEEAAVISVAEAMRWTAQGAFGVFEATFGIAVIIFGLAMLRDAFPRWLGYLGVGTGIVHLGVAVAEVVPGFEFIFIFDLLFNVWFLGLGVALLHGK